MKTMVFMKYVNNSILDLSCTNFNDEDTPKLLKFLKAHPFITILDLSWTDISFKALCLLANNKQLTHLDISYTKTRDAGLIALAKGDNNIKVLKACYIGATTESTIALSENTILQVLHLGNSANLIDPTEITPCEFQIYATQPNLIKDIGAINLAKSKTLNFLDLTDCGVGFDGIAALANHEKLEALILSTEPSRLEALTLARQVVTMPISDIQFAPNIIEDEAIACLAQSKSLKFLQLKNVTLTLKSISALAANMQLQKLSIDIHFLLNSKKSTKPSIELHELLDQAVDLICEKNPLKRVNSARTNNIPTTVPSLTHFCFFAVQDKQLTNEQLTRLPEELQEAVISYQSKNTSIDEPIIERHMNKLLG